MTRAEVAAVATEAVFLAGAHNVVVEAGSAGHAAPGTAPTSGGREGPGLAWSELFTWVSERCVHARHRAWMKRRVRDWTMGDTVRACAVYFWGCLQFLRAGICTGDAAAPAALQSQTPER